MKIFPPCRIRLGAVGLLAIGTLITANAQTSIDATLVTRPLTPGDITAYGLPDGTEVSGGLSTVGVGEAVYLEVDVATASAANAVVSWSLSSQPTGATNTLTASPLGSNVPVYGPANQLVYQAVSRKVLRPMAAGEYTVVATVTVAGVGTTNLTRTITAATYMGIDTCALCHSGGQIAQNMVVPWSKTAHATMFSQAIDGLKSDHYNASCIECHTVGYDTNTNANNGGFDDVARQLGWTFPTNLVPGNWASMQTNYPTLANLANIQCENCHGPGSEHAHNLGDTNFIAVSLSSGDCAQCHDEPPHHSTVAEWDNSEHAITTRDPSGAGRQACVGCHTGAGFIARIAGVPQADRPTEYVPINCQTCHEPHGKTFPTNSAPNANIIRTVAAVTLENGTVVTNGGKGLLCMECHHSREDATTYATSYHNYFGPHHGPQADMLEGTNGYTYGESIPSSAHRKAVGDTCVTCHMQTVADTDPGFTHVGGHTFLPGWDGSGTNAPEDLVAACQQCHGSAVTSFNFKLQDYDGDGVIEGVQTEVQHLLNKLSQLLPNANGVVDGQVKTPEPTSSWTAPELEADYNWQFVNNDGSLGIHNTAYAVGLLKASIANLTGQRYSGAPLTQSDVQYAQWMQQYFGSGSASGAAPDDVNNTNGIPNWMMAVLGLSPYNSGTSFTNEVVWNNGMNLLSPTLSPDQTNTLAIFKAADVRFYAHTNVTYQVWSISSLNRSWQKVGNPIPGTDSYFNYVTPMNTNQMFYRVTHTP